jgi:hypothetical protein
MGRLADYILGKTEYYHKKMRQEKNPVSCSYAILSHTNRHSNCLNYEVYWLLLRLPLKGKTNRVRPFNDFKEEVSKAELMSKSFEDFQSELSNKRSVQQKMRNSFK